MIAVFVWTFSGVLDAIVVGFLLLVYALYGMTVAWEKLENWLNRRKKK